MSSQHSASRLTHPAVVGLSRRRLAYSAAVLSLAVLCVLLISLSFSIKEFHAVQSLRITPQTWGVVTLGEIRDQTLEVVKQATSEESLRLRLAEWQVAMAGHSSVANLDLNEIDYDKLRARLQFAIEADQKERFLELRLEYAGRATQAERSLLKVFATDVARRLGDLGTLSQQELVKLKFDSAEIEPGRRKQNRLVSELQSQLAQLEEALEEVEQLLESATNQSEPREQSGGGIVVNPKVNQLKTLLNELLAKRDELLGQFSGSHPDVVSVRQEIEQVSLELQSLQEAASRSVQNNFVQASYGSNRQPISLAPIREAISAIDVSALRTSLATLSGNCQQTIGKMESRAVELSNALRSGPSLRVESMPGKVRASGSMNSTTVLWSILASTLIGCVVASRLDIWTLDRGYQTRQLAAKELHVPVFTLANSDVAEKQGTAATASQRILKLSEITLFTTVLVIGGMMLIDAEFRTSVWENPLHLFARLFWMLRG